MVRDGSDTGEWQKCAYIEIPANDIGQFGGVLTKPSLAASGNSSKLERRFNSL